MFNRALRLLTIVAILLGIGAPVSATTFTVPAGANLQFYLDTAQPGDTVVLQKGLKYVGQFIFPAKAAMVMLRSSGTLADRRVTPADQPEMATIASGVAAMALNLYNSAYWSIDGVAFEGNVGGFGEVIGIWGGRHIVLRRLLINLPDPQEQKRFILGNGEDITLTQSYVSGVWRSGQDSQCFAAWDGAGPYTITDNFLECASENVMFGGADSASPANVPADILIENNLFSKRLVWQGQRRGVKNLFELKSARRVVVRHNTFERNWVDAQSGSAIVFTPRNQDGTAPWSIVSDVLFEKNIVRDVVRGINISGYDDTVELNGKPHPSLQTENVVIRDNTISATVSFAVIALQEIGKLDIYRNTIDVPTGKILLYLSNEGQIATPTGTRPPQYAIRELVWADNIAPNGYIHSPTSTNEAALKAYTVSYSLIAPVTPPPPPPPTETCNLDGTGNGVDEDGNGLTDETCLPPPPTPPLQLADGERIDAAIAQLEPMLSTLTGKALTKLKDAITRLRTLRGMVQ